jgi:hypothetical protein
MRTVVICLLGVLLFTAETCEKAEVVKQETVFTSESCAPDKKVLKVVTDVEGTIGFEATSQQYFIRRAIPGTYDSVDIGMLCGNVPEGLRAAGSKVLFSGTYKEYGQPTPYGPAGRTFYYLEVSKASLIGSANGN